MMEDHHGAKRWMLIRTIDDRFGAKWDIPIRI